MSGSLEIIPLKGLPLIQPGDKLAQLLVKTAEQLRVGVKNRDVFVIGQKAVSKSEGQLVAVDHVRPSRKASELAKMTGKSPGFVELVLRDSRRVMRADKLALIVRTKRGWTCLNAGIDKSNVKGPLTVALLPRDPDGSAFRIRQEIKRCTGKTVGVIITDTHSRPFRLGQVEETIGIAGLSPFVDYRGSKDLFGYELRFKNVAVADELAGTAELVMGQGREAVPAAIVRGLARVRFQNRARSSDLVVSRREDLFRGTL
jgi:coenzyme F420-0:L-glutamate ligase / coenzyme F420-1:gamma-L-glutamate ligase